MKEAARRAGAVVMLAAGARELRATDGTRFLLIVASGATTDAVARDLDCLAARRRELDQRAAEVEPAVLAAARQSQNQENASIRKDLGRERLLLVYLTPDGRYAGLAGTSSDVAISAGTGSISKSAIDGLVPADVADVILRPRHGTASPIKIAVPEQVFHHELPKDFGRPIEVQWRASSGALLQTHQIGR